jgi:hypothetical protein
MKTNQWQIFPTSAQHHHINLSCYAQGQHIMRSPHSHTKVCISMRILVYMYTAQLHTVRPARRLKKPFCKRPRSKKGRCHDNCGPVNRPLISWPFRRPYSRHTDEWAPCTVHLCTQSSRLEFLSLVYQCFISEAGVLVRKLSQLNPAQLS